MTTRQRGFARNSETPLFISFTAKNEGLELSRRYPLLQGTKYYLIEDHSDDANESNSISLSGCFILFHPTIASEVFSQQPSQPETVLAIQATAFLLGQIR